MPTRACVFFTPRRGADTVFPARSAPMEQVPAIYIIANESDKEIFLKMNYREAAIHCANAMNEKSRINEVTKIFVHSPNTKKCLHTRYLNIRK